MIIATHNGTFHADETTACAILTYLFENSSIIRSRDPEELEKADIIIDVSNQNDDKSKIEAFCDPLGEYRYKYGVLILFGKRRDEAIVKIYSENNWEEMN